MLIVVANRFRCLGEFQQTLNFASFGYWHRFEQREVGGSRGRLNSKITDRSVNLRFHVVLKFLTGFGSIQPGGNL